MAGWHLSYEIGGGPDVGGEGARVKRSELERKGHKQIRRRAAAPPRRSSSMKSFSQRLSPIVSPGGLVPYYRGGKQVSAPGGEIGMALCRQERSTETKRTIR